MMLLSLLSPFRSVSRRLDIGCFTFHQGSHQFFRHRWIRSCRKRSYRERRSPTAKEVPGWTVATVAKDVFGPGGIFQCFIQACCIQYPGTKVRFDLLAAPKRHLAFIISIIATHRSNFEVCIVHDRIDGDNLLAQRFGIHPNNPLADLFVSGLTEEIFGMKLATKNMKLTMPFKC